MRSLLFAAFLIALFGLTGTLVSRAEPDDTSGYIFNGGFEGDFYPVGAGQVAEGWTRVHLNGNPNWQSTQVFAGPNGWVEKIEGEDSHILSVENLSVGQPFDTVLYTTVHGLTPGNTYSYSTWVLKMWGGSATTTPPPNPTALGSSIGYDLTGNSDPTANSVVWADTHYQNDRPRWVNRRTAFRASGSSVTLFMRIKLSEQRAETQVIVDAMELFDAPCAAILTPPGAIHEPRIEFRGQVPQMLLDRGNYQMYFKIRKYDAGSDAWVTIYEEAQSDDVDLPIAPGETATLLIEPFSKQPAGQPVNWPPTTHVGVWTDPVTVTYVEGRPTTANGSFRIFLPMTATDLHLPAPQQCG